MHGFLIRIVLGGLFTAAAAPLGIFAQEARGAQRTWLIVATSASAFLGTVLLGYEVRRFITDRSPDTPGFRWRWRIAPAKVLRLARAGVDLTRQPFLALARRLARRFNRWLPGPLGLWVRRWLNPKLLPPRQNTFRGRADILADLVDQHHEAMGRRPPRWPYPRRWGRRSGGTGPLLLVIYGKPGVGKSALARELAHRVRDWYPHGQLYANLGSAGKTRSAGEVLRQFLLALGWPGNEVPPDTDDRARIFRSLTTHRRVLVVLDAVRDPDQVAALMPNGSLCTVLVTSRRDLGPSLGADRPLGLGVPTVEEAVEMLSAMSLATGPLEAECAVAIVELCGRLPAALRSACDRMIEDQAHVCSVADMLRMPHARLSMLGDLRERIATEYARLQPGEQQAFRHLALLLTPTFVAWAVSALLDIDLADAEDRVAALGAAQLLEVVGRDEVSGLVRYAFHPLVRLFAEAELEAVEGLESPAVVEAAKRIERATLYVAGLVFQEADPGLQLPELERLRPRWMAGSELPRQIALQPLHWVRAEYRCLVRGVRHAYDEEWWALAWRLATRLGTCVPEAAELDPGRPDGDAGIDSGIDEVLEAFRLGLYAAEQDGDRVGGIDVLLALASFLIAIERYEDAMAVLREARDEARQLAPTDPVRAAARDAAALRRLGEAYLQLGDRGAATRRLEDAHREARRCADVSEERTIALLRAETHGFSSTVADGALDSSDERTRFTAHLVLAENARQRGNWDLARDHLRRALTLAKGDARRSANAHYRLARLSLARLHAVQSDGTDQRLRDEFARACIVHAVSAMRTFEEMRNPAGVVRARCLLVRTLAAAGRIREAELHCARAEEDLSALPAVVAPARRALHARLRRAQGELLLRQGDRGPAQQCLTEAARIFDELGDWRLRDDTLRLRDGVGPYRRPEIPAQRGRSLVTQGGR